MIVCIIIYDDDAKTAVSIMPSAILSLDTKALSDKCRLGSLCKTQYHYLQHIDTTA